MKVALIGSRSLLPENIGDFLPPETTLLLSGGASGTDQTAVRLSREKGIPLREILPDYDAGGHQAPILRNIALLDEADFVLMFWDGESPGTRFCRDYCRRNAIPYRLVFPDGSEEESFRSPK